MTYEELLKKAPEHNSIEFIEFLKSNNVVAYEDENWLVIRNYKYWQENRPWLTAFWKHTKEMQNSIKFDISLMNLLIPYADWTWLKKGADEQSVKRFHIHLHK